MRFLAGLATGLIAAVAPSAAAAAARPDPAFGGGMGYVTTQIPGSFSVAYAAAIVRGGRIVVAGQAAPRSGTSQVAVARYLPNGRLDRTFGSHGIFRSALPRSAGPFLATGVAQDKTTGKLVVGGGYGQGSMLALRLSPAGRLDRTFGRGGVAKVAAGGIGQSLALQRDGRILLGGSNANLNGRPMVVARLTRNGALDRTYGTRGRASVLFWDATLASSAGVNQMAVTSDGGAVGFGHLDYIGSDGHGSAGVFRLTSAGKPAAAFGTQGHTEVAFTKPSGAFGQWFPCAMSLVSGGRILIAGDGSVAPSAALLTIRLTAAGALDPAYGTGGRVVTPGLSNDSQTTCGASGNLVAGVGPALVQLRADGSRAGLLKITRPGAVSINAVVASGAKRVVLAGFAGRALYVARYRL